jgi:hypothetical protein
MANDIQKFFSGHQLVDAKKLAESLAGFSAAKNALMGKALLKLTKAGVWVFGADNEVLKSGTLLIAHPGSLQSGYVAWWMGKIEGEKMQPVSLGPVDATTLGEVNSGGIPPGFKKPSGKGWESQASIDLITQADTPLSLVYKTSSLGGMKALLTLAGEIAFGMSENPNRVYPLIEVSVDSYIHKEYGEVFTPMLTVEGWLGADGNPVKDLSSLL